jgi:hypothetical protein
MTNYFRKPDALVDAVRSILSGQPTETQEDIQRKSDVKMVKVKLPDGNMVMRRERPKIEIGKGKNESLDPVDQKALKGKHSDRKDKDIDNDGDVDSSDEYLHKRRKAVSKAMKEEVELDEKVSAYDKNGKVVGLYRNMADAKRLKPNHTYKIHKEGVEEGVRPNLHWKFDNDKYIETWNTQRSTKPHLGIVPAYILKTTKGKFKVVRDNRPYGQMDGYDDIESARKFLKRHSLTKFKEETEDNPANTQHLCAKNVVHESWGEGSCIPTMHADPDEDGNIEWYDVMFDHGIEEQVSIEELKVTKAESHMHSSKKKIEESKDEYEDDDDDSDEDEKNGKKKKVSGKKDDVDVEPEMDDTKMVTEKEMTPAQAKKREEIVLSMKKEMPRFKKKYGDRAKDVMYATATKMAMREGFELGIEKSDLIEEVELDEAKIAKKVPAKDGGHFVVLHRDTSGMRGTQDKFHMRHLKNGKVKDYGTHSSLDGALKFAKNRGIIEEVELDEAKSGTGYDLYHKDFSSAMQHAYDHAKKKHGITINPSEIDNKVASGPRKPSEGKTNTYRLKGDKGAIQVQVYNKGGSKPFELNMYKEETELDEAKSATGKILVADPKTQKVTKIDRKDWPKYEKKGYVQAESNDLDEGFINIGGAKVKDDEKSILQHIKKTFPNVKKVKKDPQHGWIPVFEELDLDEARGRPRKDGTTGGSEDRENIQMQLRKSVSLRGLKDVEFADGKKVKVPAKVAQGVMSKINGIKDAKQKQNAVQHIAKSHKHMMDFHKGDYKDADAKRQDILKLK